MIRDIRSKVTVLVSLVGLIAVAACGGKVLADQSPPPLTLDALKNATYLSDWTAEGVAQLVDGECREKFMLDSASELVVSLGDRHAFGDLNGDGLEDAVVLLATNSGGSGTFIHLAVVLNRDGNPENVAVQFLGDRAQIEALSIQGGKVTVAMAVQGPDDPMCCPSVKVVQKYEMRGEKLVQSLGG